MPKPGSRSALEAQLTALTQEFVVRLVQAIRNASFADVAALSGSAAVGAGSEHHRFPRSAVKRQSAKRAESGPDVRVRQTAAHRAELGEQVLRTLQGVGRPLGVRALSSEMGIAPDLLALPLRELRVAGRIKKHGEKRATTYSTV
jgi:hypothetical protein